MVLTWFNTLETNPYSNDIGHDCFQCGLNEWFMYKNPSNLEQMLPWDVVVLWI